MHILRKRSAPRYIRDEGITSWLLASSRTSAARHLTTTLVEIDPGGSQRVHSHEPEQIYFILDGRGMMTVGDETSEVSPGDCVFIPGGEAHGLVNTTPVALRYFSAAAPAFEGELLESLWPLPAEEDA